MKYFKHLIAMLIIVALSITLVELAFEHDNVIYKIIPILLLFMFVFSFSVRKIARFKPLFTSRYNIFTSKFRSNVEFSFSKKLLFHKIIEVLEDSGFNVKHTHEDKGEIFATSPITWLSWGENIYIDLEEVDGMTVMKFCSASFFGIYSWGKNEQNYNKLLNKFEESLVI